ncbi:hypothetical protein, partial [Streptomyces mesophilus]|uniref:hypothetical protein n=1 Tax=Streptomyces mesophilus TaxID=1775132 RepID=UPI0019D25ACC
PHPDRTATRTARTAAPELRQLADRLRHLRTEATPMTAATVDPSRATVCLTPAEGSRRCFTAGDEP